MIKKYNKLKYMFLKKGGQAINITGDISRDYYDAELIVIDSEDIHSYIGHFAEGFGFINVRFKKSDCRLATMEEIELCKQGKMEEIKF